MRRRLPVALLLLTGMASCVAPSAQTPPVVPAPPVAAPEKAPLPEAPLVLRGEARQGSALYGTVPPGTVALRLGGQPVPFAPDGAFMVAFDRDSPTTLRLEADRSDGSTVARDLAVAPGNWRIEQVNASLTAGIPTAEFQARRAGELARIEAARATSAVSDGWRQSFIWPVRARISGLFGSQRIYRGTPGSYHSGVDIAAPAGATFVAPAGGVVVLAAQEPFTLEGRLLIIDHGMGLSSAFLHCARLDVKEGDVVHQGQVLGTVGATGRATGPHLHWGMKWTAARIDPVALVSQPTP
ncbi:M23 family metallopeptidase [Sphingobium subterraneum]|uniref:Murein DD-endopeptidase MepM/ murein hydrolase activator NlpD n=1 Tax=Sphingobium subterraneum TaxID=627688 RepID=A0A841J0Q1_9SPHN|nr:M23 family metallopeptidase [Sphingobium subterraneum]MBB6124503.1 murein DD-endopeptidase MepM/ murein hydrolase activator NlpD [Sphingobium subterraneum]